MQDADGPNLVRYSSIEAAKAACETMGTVQCGGTQLGEDGMAELVGIG